MKNTNRNLLTAAFILLSGMLSFSSLFAQNGNVGIGTTDPHSSAILDLTSTNQGLLMPRLSQSQENSLGSVTGLVFYNTDRLAFRYHNGFNYHNVGFWSGEAGTTNIFYEGNVGIGTINPNIDLAIGDTDTGFQQQGDGQLAVYTNNVERARFNQFGNFGIGTSSPSQKLHVSGNGYFTGNVGIGTAPGTPRLLVSGFAKVTSQLSVGANPSTFGNVAVQVGVSAGDNQAAYFRSNQTDVSGGFIGTLRIDNANSSGSALWIGSGFAAQPGGGMWANSSDARLKQNVEKYRDGLQQIREVRTVTYQYNEKSGHSTDITYVGIIAQELQKIAPHMIKKNGEYLMVDPSAFTYMLVNAVQEQDQIITDQQKEIDELKARLDRIEALLEK